MTKSESTKNKNKDHSQDGVSQNKNSLFLACFIVALAAFGLGLVTQKNFLGSENAQHSHQNSIPLDSQSKQTESKTSSQSPHIDLETLKKELSEQIRKEIIAEAKKKDDDAREVKSLPQKLPLDTAKDQDDIINDKKTEKQVKKEKTKADKAQTDKTKNEPKSKPAATVVIDDKMVEQSKGDIQFANDGKPIVINPSDIKFRVAGDADETPKKPIKKTEPVQDKKSAEKISANEKSKPVSASKKSSGPKISEMKPKKIWIPIPNSNGGHVRCQPVEVNPAEKHLSSVKVWLFEEFVSEDESKQLIDLHESKLKRLRNQKPIICFDSVETLRQRLVDLGREKFATHLSSDDFTTGTYCLNQTYSRQLEKWGLKWSFATTFLAGENKFAKIIGKRIEDSTMLNETHGGKFQLISFPMGVDYRDHANCHTITEEEDRDKYATFSIFLNELGATGGGEIKFPQLGIDIKPRTGRAVVWNNMNYNTGECESMASTYSAKVEHEVKKKYAIQRKYYYRTFAQLGKRAANVELPARPADTPKVMCDRSDLRGSCRMTDEWTADHLVTYRESQNAY